MTCAFDEKFIIKIKTYEENKRRGCAETIKKKNKRKTKKKFCGNKKMIYICNRKSMMIVFESRNEYR